MYHAHAIIALTIRPLVNVATWTLFTVVTVIILAALTGIFVMWLLWIGLLIAAIAISDVIHRSRRRWSARPRGALKHQPIG